MAADQPKRTVRFAAFVNEEPPHFLTSGMGSLVHARRARARGEDIVAMLARQRKTNFTPGTRYMYSNSGYLLMSLIVQRVSGKPIREFARERPLAAALTLGAVDFIPKPCDAHLLKARLHHQLMILDAERQEQLGAPSGSVRTEARADAQPVYHEFMPTGESGNRRAEIFLIF